MTHHELAATPETVRWGMFDASFPPVLEVASGDRVTIHTVSGEGHVIGVKPVIVVPSQVDSAVSPFEVKPVIILRVDGDGQSKASSDEKKKEQRRKLIR